jgi:uncharacterized protein (DUF1778 family)
MRRENKTETIILKATKKEKDLIEARALENNFQSVSEFIRVLALKGKLEIV